MTVDERWRVERRRTSLPGRDEVSVPPGHGPGQGARRRSHPDVSFPSRGPSVRERTLELPPLSPGPHSDSPLPLSS